jgi:RnfABCDGE-type electron transport complex B subunit
MITYAMISLGGIGAIGVIILYWASVKYHVDEDPRIATITEVLPGANCGGCGLPGCAAFAAACVKTDSLDELVCPAGGNETMTRIASILGKTANVKEQKIAVIKCNGNCEVRPRICHYDGAKSCAVISSLYSSETGCSYGCFGFGDCVGICSFNAIRINPITLIAEVDENKCTSCGACIKACPKNIIKLRKKGPKSRRIYVACVNRDKGSVARKACANACIGCGKCIKECAFEAITLKDNVAHIEDTKCRLCRKCPPVCPTGSIVEYNFPPKKIPVQPESPLKKNFQTI